MFDWFREILLDWQFMRGKVTFPGIEREFDRAARKVVTLDGKEPTRWRVYRKVRRDRKRQETLGA